MKMIPEKHRAWIYFVIILIVIIQFFWVLGKYETIESHKVFKWTLIIALPVSLIVVWIIKERITNSLFYSLPKRYNKKSISRKNHLKNVVISYALAAAAICFSFYGTVIQTNDWFGKEEHHTFDTRIISVDLVQHARFRKSISGGNITYNIQVNYKGETICLKTETPYSKGDNFNKTLNVGGLWGVIYEE